MSGQSKSIKYTRISSHAGDVTGKSIETQSAMYSELAAQKGMSIMLYARVSTGSVDSKYSREQIADFQAQFNKTQGGNKWLTVDANHQRLRENFRDFTLIKKNFKIE